MKKAKVVIASVLKPVTDTRAFYKLAISLRETNKYQINIIGFLRKNPPKLSNIEFTAIFGRHRLHPLRLLAPFIFFLKLKNYKPDLVIVTTYELLWPSILAKVLFGNKLIYDLQENYSKNVNFHQTLPILFRRLVVKGIQIMEKSSQPYVDHYFFAEECYIKEFPQIKNWTLLENKYQGKPVQSAPISLARKESLQFLISGTLTPAYGIENAFYWFKELAKENPSYQLHVIGHVPLKDFKNELEKLGQNHNQIHLRLAQRPVPYPDIKKQLLNADILLLPYLQSPAIMPKIPTKLYEALALNIPVLTTKNPRWEKLLDRYKAGIGIDFSNPKNAKNDLDRLINQPLYTHLPGKEVTWASEEEKLIQVVDGLVRIEK
ncbi:glycosyltransferase [Echinicola jeungdonensis]|uniref:Glycosyltransferase n=1 Tax=Echinicola jeungdonensis TaxID=709343 RepID=A0ABV5J717_9BACT|nr:glycosyltransferase [Echinicola jeungdonensis]MDN3670745.1 glycosyltransferase [Echinicola jeungdonensis]